MPAFYDCAEASAFEFILNPFLFFFTNSSYEVRHSRQHRLDNAFRRFTIDLPCRRNGIRDVSSSIGTSRALDTSVVVAAPSTPPSSLDVRADVYDDTPRAPLQIFFASSGDTRSADANTQRAATHERSRELSHSIGRNDDARMSRASCAAKWGEIRGEIPGSVTAKRCASRANQNVSQSSAPAATGAGAAAAAAGLRTGAARFGAASRSLRATAGAGGETGTAAAAGTARGA